MIINIRRRIIISLLLLIIINHTACRQTHAQAANLTISPSFRHVAIHNDQRATLNYRLLNNGDPITVSVLIIPLKVQANTNTLIVGGLLPTGVEFNLTGDAINLKEPFIIHKNAEKQFNLEINTLQSATKGEFYLGLLVQSEYLPDPEGITSIQIKSQLISPIILNINTDKIYEFGLSPILFEAVNKRKFEIFGKKYIIFDTDEYNTLSLIIYNGAPITSYIEGLIKLDNNFGYRYYYPINKQLILPQAQKNIVANSTHPKTSASLAKITLPSSQPGIYKAEAIITDKRFNKQINAITNYLVLPIKTIILLSFFVFMLSLYLILTIFRIIKN